MSCRLLCGDAAALLKTLPARSVQTCVTSPPYYGLRSYLPDDHPDKHLEIGLEGTPDAFVARLVDVFREVRRVLRDTGTLWLNIGDKFADKQLMLLPARVALALQSDGWYLRSDIILAKANPMPESVVDRPTRAHEYLFLLAKSERYYYAAAAIADPAIKGAAGSTFTGGKTGVNGMGRVSQNDRKDADTRNKRDVWPYQADNFDGAHFAVMPSRVIQPCVLAGSKAGDTVLDPFMGTGSVGKVARSHLRSFIGIDLDERNIIQAQHRIGPMLLDTPTDTVDEEEAS